MLRPLLLVTLLALALPSHADNPRLLILGDSLSAAFGMAVDDGWTRLLEKRIQQVGLPHQVVNASVSGETTAGGLTRLPELLRRHAPRVVVIELGANDGLRGFSFDQVGSRLTELVELSQRSGAKVLLVGVRLPPNYGRGYNWELKQMYLRVAKRSGTPLVPELLAGVAEELTTKPHESGEPKLMQPDGLHPTAAAQPRLLDNLWPQLEPLLEATRAAR